MTFEQAIKLRDELDAKSSELGKKLKTYPRGPLGNTTDEARKSKEYQKDHKEFKKVFTQLQNINKVITRNFKKEYKKYRDEKRLKR